MKRWDYSSDVSSRRQIEKGGEKNPGRQFMFVTWFSLAGGCISLSASHSFSSILPLCHPSAIVTQPLRCFSEPFLLKARGQRSEELLVSGFHPRGFQPQGGASRAGLLFKRHMVCFHHNSGWMPDVKNKTLVRSGEVHHSLPESSPAPYLIATLCM